VKAILLNLFAMILSIVATADPIITGISGNFNHKSQVTIIGNNFGIKVKSAPVVWDDASGTNMSTTWDIAVPNSAANSNYNMQYRSKGYRNVDGPHANSQKYIVGGHTNTWNAYAGGAVMISKIMPSRNEGSIFYQRAYYRLDPNWQFANTGDTNDNNHKWWAANFGGAGPYENTYNYIDYDQGKFTNGTSVVQHKYSPGTPEHTLTSPDVNGHSNWWSSSANPVSKWTLYEVEYKISTTTNGYLKVWADGALVMNYAGRTDFNTSSSMAFGFGGYSATYTISPINNFRYFSDIYMDNTAARVVLGNNELLSSSTIIEPQIPSAWSTNSISVNVNLGKFSAGQTAYLFVVDANGVRNAKGFAITVGGSSNPQPPPPIKISVPKIIKVE
jgi:hypothetical protein